MTAVLCHATASTLKRNSSHFLNSQFSYVYIAGSFELVLLR